MVVLRRRDSREDCWRRVVAKSVFRRRRAVGSIEEEEIVDRSSVAVFFEGVGFVECCHCAFSASRAAILLFRWEPDWAGAPFCVSDANS